MRVAEVRLSTGELLLITKEWFIDIVARGGPYTETSHVEAHYGDGTISVNPKFIVWARVLEKKT